MKQETTNTVVHAMPPGAAVLAFLTDTTPERWLTYIGIFVLALQAVYWSVKIWKERK